MRLAHCRYYPQFTVTHEGETKKVSMLNAALILSEGGILGEAVHDSDGAARPISEPEKQQVMGMARQQQQS